MNERNENIRTLITLYTSDFFLKIQCENTVKFYYPVPVFIDEPYVEKKKNYEYIQ